MPDRRADPPVPSAAEAGPEPMIQVAPAEKLLLASLRAWTESPTPEMRRKVCGVLAHRTDARVGALFCAWIQAVEAGRLRPMVTRCQHCEGPGPDVQRLVLACGLAPVDMDLGGDLIGSLVFDTEGVMILARALNAALCACGWPLPSRVEAVREAAAERRALH